jgi:hypothetical protein
MLLLVMVIHMHQKDDFSCFYFFLFFYCSGSCLSCREFHNLIIDLLNLNETCSSVVSDESLSTSLVLTCAEHGMHSICKRRKTFEFYECADAYFDCTNYF